MMVAATLASEDAQLVDAQVCARRAEFALSISRYVARFGTVMLVLVAVLWGFWLRQYTQLLAFAALIVPIVTSAWSCPALHRRGQTTTGINLLLISLLLSLAVGSVLVPETLLAAVPVYVLLIILSTLLLSGRNSVGLIGVFILTFIVVVVLVQTWDHGWFPPLDKTTELVIGTSFGAFALLAVAVMIRQIVLQQESSFQQSQRANLEIERRAAAEREQREHLQATVRQYVDYMAAVGQGNLAGRLSLSEGGHRADHPLVVLGQQLNETVANLQGMIRQIRGVVGSLNSAVGEILAASTEQTTGANEQSTAITQASSTMDETRTIAGQTAQRAQDVARLAQQTAQVSQAGRQAVTETITGMEQVKEKVESIAAGILDLSRQTQAIGKITATVNEIAAQSNLLALNAAVEAARAGEAGKGFAVVAQEVRSLAEQSRGATVQIKGILSQIQHGVNTAVIATEEGMKDVDVGIKLAGEAGLSIQELAESVTASTRAAVQIAAAAEQQRAGMEQVTQMMTNVHQVATQSVAGARQTERAAAELSELADQLRELVEQYQL